jgi:choline dehydrogenase-like flavoprotein
MCRKNLSTGFVATKREASLCCGARQVQRWSRFEFEAPGRDGFAVDWPIRYNDLAPWYSYVEKFVGISGNRDGLETLPDSEVMKAWEMNCVEKHVQEKIKEAYKDRNFVIGRCAHLTEPQEIHKQQGRGPMPGANIM